MALPIKSLKTVLLDLIGELRDTQKEAASKNLASVDFQEEITVSVRLIATGGTNALKRVSISRAGESVQRDITPAVTERVTAGEEVSTEESLPTVSSETSETKHRQQTSNGSGGGDTVTTDQTIKTG